MRKFFGVALFVVFTTQLSAASVEFIYNAPALFGEPATELVYTAAVLPTSNVTINLPDPSVQVITPASGVTEIQIVNPTTTSAVFNVTYSDGTTIENNFGVNFTHFGSFPNGAGVRLTIVNVGPVFSKAFSAPSVKLNGTAGLTFTIADPTFAPLTGLTFSDTLPAGLTVASPNGLTNTCGGVVSAVANTGVVALSGGGVAANSSCTISVNVTATAVGTQNNVTGAITSNEGGTGGTASASIIVPFPPAITKLFGATSVAANGNTSLTFSITNTNTSTTLTGIAFTDAMPSGLVVAAPNGLVGSCGGGTITAVPRSTAVSLSGAALAASTSCTFSVNVTGTTTGPQINSVTVTSDFGTGNTSTTSVTVTPASAPPSNVTCPATSSAEVNVPFSSPAITVTGGTPPYTFSVVGTLPAGLTLNTTTGAVTGTPTATGAFSIQATDSTGAVIGTCPFTINLTVTSNAAFLMRYAANLNIGESYIDITNTGANGAALLGPGFGTQSGNICVNVYAFDPGEELISCCSCLVTPDQTVNLGVNRDLTVKTLTGVVPNSVTVKLLASLAGGNGTGTSCTNSAAGATTANLVSGMTAWGTTLHANPVGGYDSTEAPFTVSTLSQSELASIGGRCSAILGNGSGFGICNSCRAGALGAGALGQ